MDFALDLNPASPSFGDLALVTVDGRVRASTVAAAPQLKQEAHLALQIGPGEYTFDKTWGFDWLKHLGKKPGDDLELRADVADTLLGLKGCAALDAMQITVDPRTRDATVAYRLTYGTPVASTSVSGSVGIG